MRLFSSSHPSRCLQVCCVALVVSVMLLSPQLAAQAQGKGSPVQHPTLYRTREINGLSIFYREAGPKCMSSEHFGQLAWQFKRMSGSSGLKVQAAIAC